MAEMEKVLRVTLEILKEAVRLSGMVPIRITLTNSSAETVTVNTRMAMGYQDMESREVFLKVFKPGTGAVVSTPALLYNRDYPGPNDYRQLAPGESISGEYDLLEWYDLPDAGSYELQAFYQADEDHPGRPEEVVSGIFASDRLEFEVING